MILILILEIPVKNCFVGMLSTCPIILIRLEFDAAMNYAKPFT